jgi:hypothetical protein
MIRRRHFRADRQSHFGRQGLPPISATAVRLFGEFQFRWGGEDAIADKLSEPVTDSAADPCRPERPATAIEPAVVAAAAGG